jgi:phosphopantothenoylcysteine decarboxylase / phosphopantothenate---cysteine ligase
MLLNRQIIVGICGGIASYKAIDLVSKLQQAGALVDVIMTESAEEFIRPLTFSAISHRRVYANLWEPSGEAAELHIKLAEEADLLVVAPATANTIAKLAHGLADNMLAAVALTTRAPIVLAPAMHAQMYTHPATQANLTVLRERGAFIVEPEVGRLASGEIGIGRFPETATLLGAIQKALGQHGDLAGRRIVITAGGTHESIDPVRYIGNRSSGKMGYNLAMEARDRGAHVILVSGPVTLPAPFGVEIHLVETAIQMRDAVYSFITDADALIMSAAVADFRPEQTMAHKIKKRAGNEDTGLNTENELTLHLVHNPDILGELVTNFDGGGHASGENNGRPIPHLKKHLIRVGFAAETEHLVEYAQQKLRHKQLDLLIANDVSRIDSGFGTDTNKVLIFHADGAMEDLPVMPKTGVAAAILDRVVPLLSLRSGT